MADLSAPVYRPMKDEGGLWEYGLVGYTAYQGGSAAYTVYKGDIAILDVSDVDGYAQKLLYGVAAASGDVFLGIFADTKSVTSADTANGSVKARAWSKGVFGFPKNSITVTDIGAPCYCTDSNIFQTSSSNALWIGEIVDVDDTYVWVDISHATRRANSAT